MHVLQRARRCNDNRGHKNNEAANESRPTHVHVAVFPSFICGGDSPSNTPYIVMRPPPAPAPRASARSPGTAPAPPSTPAGSCASDPVLFCFVSPCSVKKKDMPIDYLRNCSTDLPGSWSCRSRGPPPARATTSAPCPAGASPVVSVNTIAPIRIFKEMAQPSIIEQIDTDKRPCIPPISPLFLPYFLPCFTFCSAIRTARRLPLAAVFTSSQSNPVSSSTRTGLASAPSSSARPSTATRSWRESEVGVGWILWGSSRPHPQNLTTAYHTNTGMLTYLPLSYDTATSLARVSGGHHTVSAASCRPCRHE